MIIFLVKYIQPRTKGRERVTQRDNIIKQFKRIPPSEVFTPFNFNLYINISSGIPVYN